MASKRDIEQLVIVVNPLPEPRVKLDSGRMGYIDDPHFSIHVNGVLHRSNVNRETVIVNLEEIFRHHTS